MRAWTSQWRAAGFVAVLLACGRLVQAESLTLQESPEDTRGCAVALQLELTGTSQAPGQDGKPENLSTSASAKFQFTERRISGAGRDAEAFRSARLFSRAEASIAAGQFKTVRGLRSRMRMVVAEGQREGVRTFSPAGPFTYDELELLEFPGDPLAAVAMLPDDNVDVGETWRPSDWVVQLLTGVEAVENSSLSCKLEEVKGKQARVSFTGSVQGADLGATTKVEIVGDFVFDLDLKLMTKFQIKQTEKRSAGPISPAFDVSAAVEWTRTVVAKPDLSDDDIKALPIEPNPATLLLVFEEPAWGVRFYYNRDWHVFHRTPKVAILRLMVNGTLVAQCNVSSILAASPGQHLAEATFVNDVKRVLGANLDKVLEQEKLPSERMFVYRVNAVGGVERVVPKPIDPKAKETADTKKPAAKPVSQKSAKDGGLEPEPMPEMQLVKIPYQWIYYLLAAPDGRQAVFSFVVESTIADQLKGQDVSLVGTAEFIAK